MYQTYYNNGRFQLPFPQLVNNPGSLNHKNRIIPQFSGENKKYLNLRIFQYTSGTYPRTPNQRFMKEFLSFSGFRDFLEYAPRVCWGFLRLKPPPRTIQPYHSSPPPRWSATSTFAVPFVACLPVPSSDVALGCRAAAAGGPRGGGWTNPATFHQRGVSKNRGTPKWMVKIMENPIFWWMILRGKPSIFGNIHISVAFFSDKFDIYPRFFSHPQLKNMSQFLDRLCRSGSFVFSTHFKKTVVQLNHFLHVRGTRLRANLHRIPKSELRQVCWGFPYLGWPQQFGRCSLPNRHLRLDIIYDGSWVSPFWKLRDPKSDTVLQKSMIQGKIHTKCDGHNSKGCTTFWIYETLSKHQFGG